MISLRASFTTLVFKTIRFEKYMSGNTRLNLKSIFVTHTCIYYNSTLKRPCKMYRLTPTVCRQNNLYIDTYFFYICPLLLSPQYGMSLIVIL